MAIQLPSFIVKLKTTPTSLNCTQVNLEPLSAHGAMPFDWLVLTTSHVTLPSSEATQLCSYLKLNHPVNTPQKY